jgi:hypothetical protein
MPLPVITNVYRCALHWVNTFAPDPAEAINVIHVQSGIGDVTDIGNLIASFIDNNSSTALNVLSSVFELQNVQVTPLDGTSGATDCPQSGTFGSTGGDYIPQGSAVVSLKTGGRGPQARGRIYLGPIAESKTQNGQLIDNDVCAGGWEDIRTDFIAGDISLVVASYEHSVARTVTSCSVKPFLRTQRRRAVAN